MSATETLFARLTPPGRGAVATVAIFGPRAVQCCDREFAAASGRPLDQQPIGRIVFGRWGGQLGEELVVCRTSADELEIHCHGGQAAVARIAESLIAHGCSEISWQRYFESRMPDRIALAAAEALPQASTERAALVLVDQLNGALSRAMQQIRDAISRGDSPAASAIIDRLLQWAPLGLHLTQPWRVVLAGPPNVGKSSLINALVGFRRSLVFDQPGTTRDVVTTTTAFRGWPVELSDTAGLRDNADTLESAGIERTQQQLTSADLILLVFDLSQPWTAEHQQLCDAWPSAIVVHNKADLRQLTVPLIGGAFLERRVSAINGKGVGELATAIITRLIPNEVTSEEAVPFEETTIRLLKQMRNSIELNEPVV